MNSMAAMIKRVSSAPRVRRPGGALRFGRTALLAGWVVFALAAILFPCIEAIAAPVSDHENVTETIAGTAIDHPLNNESLVTEHSDHGSGSSWCDLASAAPWNGNISLTLTTNDSPSGWVAVEALATPFLAGLTRSQSLAQHEIPPPPRRLYLRTLRLLI